MTFLTTLLSQNFNILDKSEGFLNGYWKKNKRNKKHAGSNPGFFT